MCIIVPAGYRSGTLKFGRLLVYFSSGAEHFSQGLPHLCQLHHWPSPSGRCSPPQLQQLNHVPWAVPVVWYSARGSLLAQTVKNLPIMQETRVRSLFWNDPLEKEMATHSRILAWSIPMDRGARRATVHGVTKSQTQQWLTLTYLLRVCSVCKATAAKQTCEIARGNFPHSGLDRLPQLYENTMFPWNLPCAKMAGVEQRSNYLRTYLANGSTK